MTTNKPAFLKASDISGLADMVAQMDAAGGKPMDKLESGTTLTSNFRRILPQHPNMKGPVQVIPVHFRVGPSGRQLVCPRRLNGGECPLCTHGFAMIKDGDEEGGKDILPSWRAYLNVIKLTSELEVEEDKVYVLSLNKTQFEDLSEDVFNELYGDVTNLETGRPVDFAAKKAKRGNFEFNVIKYRVGDASPFEIASEVLEDTVDLSDYIEYRDAAGIMEVLEGQGSTAIGEGDGKLPFQLPEAKAPDEAPANPGGFSPLEDDGEETPEAEAETQQVSDPAEAISKLKAKAKRES
ncbi:hypothetical protein LCGC14_1418660 [marine sediment metagenome]|uniref:Bacteriophage T4 Gp32 single-stranded DNA-binding domain-containing protein n=1 Tax=marine sediment metagenome TaxID=412755 RepID=A0A0F9JRV1_9ZZZZ